MARKPKDGALSKAVLLSPEQKADDYPYEIRVLINEYGLETVKKIMTLQGVIDDPQKADVKAVERACIRERKLLQKQLEIDAKGMNNTDLKRGFRKRY